MTELTHNNMCVVVGLPQMIGDFKEVTHGVAQPLLYYDTTFCPGDFYVSAILYCSAVFEGAPVQPLLMLVHERSNTESHDLVMRWLGKLCGLWNHIAHVCGGMSAGHHDCNTFCFLQQQLCTVVTTYWVMFQLGVDHKTVTDWSNFVCEVCSANLLANPFQIDSRG